MYTLDEQGQELGEKGSQPIIARIGLQVLCNGEVKKLLLIFLVEEFLLLLLLVLLF
jgi:hypothetical protein